MHHSVKHEAYHDMHMLVLATFECSRDQLENHSCGRKCVNMDGDVRGTHRQAGLSRAAPEATGVDEVQASGGQQHERGARRCCPPLVQVLQHEGDRLVKPAAARFARSQLACRAMCPACASRLHQNSLVKSA